VLHTLKTELTEIAQMFRGSDSLIEKMGVPIRDKSKLKVKQERELYQQPDLLPEMLDFHRYIAKHRCFISSDNRNFGTVFEVGLLHTTGKTEEYAIEKRDLIATAIRYIPQHHNNPYVLQTFAQDEPLVSFIDDIAEYQSQFGKDNAYRAEYQRLWGAHLKKLSRPGGYFQNKRTGSRWGGIIRKVRFCIYRDLSNYDSNMYSSPEEEIAEVTDQVRNGLEASGLITHLYDPADVYQWLVPWFNPFPEGEESGHELARKYPLEYQPGNDYLGLDDQLFKSYPLFDVENRCITFNNKLHSTVVSVDRFNKNPDIGAWTHTSYEAGQRSATAFERLPEGCIICSTTVFVPSYETESKLDEVSDHSKGHDDRTRETKKQIGETKIHLDSNNVLLPSSTYIYVHGLSHAELKRNRARIMSVLRTLSFDPIDLNADLHPLDTYVKYLPFSYKPGYDKYLYRNRLSWDRHISNLLPVFGSSTGTGNHGIVFSNPEGMPMTFDPLNSADKTQNSFMGILAPPGAGKSALLNQLIAAMKATHNPFFVIIDVNGSFKLHQQYFEELGISTHYMEVNPGSELSLPLFELAVEAYLNEIKSGATGVDDEEEIDLGEKSPDDEVRDPMGEMILTAKLMVTKGMEQGEKDFKPNDINMLNNAILHAGKTVYEAGSSSVKPMDVVNALWHISETGEMFGQEHTYREERRHRAADMAEAMTDFTRGVKGQFFNRDGATSWPVCDLLVLDLKMLAKEGYEDILYLTFIGLMNAINSNIAKRRGYGRQTIVINDEAHIINMVRTLALFKRKSIKMWRKEGCWLWDATQNIKDYPQEAIDILGVMEWLILLKMPKAEVEALKKFRDISAEEESMIANLTSEKGKYVEGVVLSNKVRAMFRSVPPTWYLVLGQTEEQEYGERVALMEEHGITEVAAGHMIAETVEERRCAI